MAPSFLARDISDLCLGKQPLKGFPVSATVAEAISAMKTCGESFISIWACNHATEVGDSDESDSCECVGKVCMVDVVRYLCTDDENLSSPSEALQAPVSVLLPKSSAPVLHVLSSCSLVEAMDMMVQGAQNLVVPICTRKRRLHQAQSLSSSSQLVTTHKHGREFCWISHEDILRFLLGSIAAFSSLSGLSLRDLGLVSPALSLDFSAPALSPSPQTALAVVYYDDGAAALVGEISPYALRCQDETVAAAVATLSAGELAAYLSYGGSPPDEFVEVVRARLVGKGLMGMVRYLDDSRSGYGYSSSSYDELTATRRRSSSRKTVVCGPTNTLAAVMVQAITNRVNYAWVMDDDGSLVGIVTFVEMLRAFSDYLKSLG